MATLVDAPCYAISFGACGHPPIQLAEGTALPEALTVLNSPILFGCRTGICGTCLSVVAAVRGVLPAPADEERELLKILCPNEPKARLACQIRACADIEIQPLKSE